MNVFGVDYDQVHCCVALGERRDGTNTVQMVGDGSRVLIPLAVASEDDAGHESLRWGSGALRDGKQSPLKGDLYSAGPWMAAPGAPRFVGQLFQHLRGYIGQVDPNPRSGYSTVVATTAPDSKIDAGVKSLFREAGFGEVEVISTSQAVLCDWLSRVRETASPAVVIVAVAIGDGAASAAAIKLKGLSGGRPKFEAGTPGSTLVPVGHEHLARRLLSMVWERSKVPQEDVRPETELALSGALIGFADLLGRAKDDEMVEWRGPLSSRMFTDLKLQRDQVAGWDEVQRWKRELPGLVQDAVSQLGNNYKPDLLVLGGIGACWPFVAEALRPVGKVVTVPQTWESVARGSTSWPVFGAGWGTKTARRLTQPGDTEIITKREAPSSRSGVPPWERD